MGATVAALLGGCGGTTDTPLFREESIELANPVLDTLAITEPFGIGAFLITAKSADSTFQLTDSTRIRLSVWTSRGDREELLIGPEVCTLPDGRMYACRVFFVEMREGSHIKKLAPYLPEVGARFRLWCCDGLFGSIYVFRETVGAAVERARHWPGVKTAALAWVERGPAFHDSPLPKRLFGGVLLEIGEAPVAGDDRLQVVVGEEVTFEYLQPTGRTLRANGVFECTRRDPHAIGGPPVVIAC